MERPEEALDEPQRPADHDRDQPLDHGVAQQFNQKQEQAPHN